MREERNQIRHQNDRWQGSIRYNIRWSCHSGLANSCENCVGTSCPQQCGPDLPCLGKPVMQTVMIAGTALQKTGAVCHIQIHGRKQISIMCNKIEHWVRRRCAGIRQGKYTDTWTCHQHKESRLTSHTTIIIDPGLGQNTTNSPQHHLHGNTNTDT